jgi:hypothetical protein
MLNYHNETESSNMLNYHNEKVVFNIGQSITHVTDEGKLVCANVINLSDDNYLELQFEDGDQGIEHMNTCF